MKNARFLRQTTVWLCALFVLSQSIKAQPIPEIIHYKFDQTGNTVTNHASSPPSGAATGSISGAYTQGGTGQCGGALLGASGTSTTNSLNTNWITNLGSNSWTIAFWASGMTTNTALYYIFSDDSANNFRCFTNGVAGGTNWILRGGGLSDVTLPNGAQSTPTHNAFVYDAANNQVRAYLNGNLVNTVAQPSITIIGTNTFKIGAHLSNIGIPPGGSLDEFRVYNRALSPAEILSLVQISAGTRTDTRNICGNSFTWIDGNTYTSNNNTASFTLAGAAANGCDSIINLNLTLNSPATRTDTRNICGNSFTWIDGNTYTSNNNTASFTLAGAAANGCDSIINLNLTLNSPATRTDTRNLCGSSFTWIDGNTYTSNNNTASFTLAGAAANGCDSVISLDLTLRIPPSNMVEQIGDFLYALDSNANYQWLDCDNNFAPVVGARSSAFRSNATGNFALEVEANGCVDTSACFFTLIAGLDLFSSIRLDVFPNPARDYVDLLWSEAGLLSSVRLRVLNGLGQEVLPWSLGFSGQHRLDLRALSAGIYLIEWRAGDLVRTHRFVKLQ